MNKSVVSTIALLAAAGAANAAIVGTVWREVNNAVNPYGGPSPLTDPQVTAFGPIRTFDLFLIGNQVGEVINGLNLGNPGSADPYGMNVNGAVFNHTAGGNARSSNEAVFQGFFPGLLIDTFALFGGTPTTLGVEASFVGGINMTGASNQIRFTSFVSPGATNSPATMVGSANPAGAELWVLRVSVAGNTTILGNGVAQIGLAQGVLVDVIVHNAIPTPGALALLGLAGLTAGRRRR